MSRLTNQRNAVLGALLAGEALTQPAAQERFKCYRLASRIHELREAGHLILSLREPGSDGFVTYLLLAEGGAAR